MKLANPIDTYIAIQEIKQFFVKYNLYVMDDLKEPHLYFATITTKNDELIMIDRFTNMKSYLKKNEHNETVSIDTTRN